MRGAHIIGRHGGGAGVPWELRDGVGLPRWKRVMDLCLLVVVAPAVVAAGVLVGCWIAVVSRGGVLFCQRRLGRGGVPFKLYKFRSMRAGAATGCHEEYVRDLVRNNRPLRKLDALGDPRVIPGGRLLRSLGLDELPQVLNVLRGEMSFIGPRPCLPCEAAFYDLCRCRRFDVLPGITGLWQVERNERTTFCEMLEMDERYVRELSLSGDLGILVRTPLALLGQVLAGRGQADGLDNSF